MIELEIDGKKVVVREGRTVMDAANELGITIPHFCYHRKLSISANCRMCLVDIEKSPKPMPACATLAMPGMIVRTASERARLAQRAVMEFLLIRQRLPLPGGKARRPAKEPGAAGVGAGDGALHPLHALRAFWPRNRRDHGTGHGRPR
jgi:ferredoxin